MRSLLALLTLGTAFSTGCIVVHDNTPPPTPATCNIPTQAASTTVPTTYHVLANMSTQAADLGYVVTANGMGDYTLAFRDATNTGYCFSGIVTVASRFLPARTSGVGVTPQLTADNQVRFAAFGSSANVSLNLGAQNAEPIFVDAFINGAHAGNIYFSDSLNAGLDTSVPSPASFTSP